MSNWKADTAKIQQTVTTLSIGWLNHQFAAVSIHRGVVAGTWETTFAAEGEPDLSSLIREAVQKTNYHGTTVSLLLAHPKLAQQLAEVPPVTGSALAKILEREAQQQKSFHGAAAWTFQNSLPVGDSRRVIVHLLPDTLLNQLIKACQQNGLHLNSVTPVSAVLHQQLALLPLNEGDVALLAAETGGSTTVVVGRADGELLLVRTLLDNWNENAARLALDLKRTLSFTTQQYDLAVNCGVWLFGAGAAAQAPALQRLLEVPVAVSPVAYRSDFWPVETAKLHPAISPNFIGLELQNAPQRRKFAWVVVIATALLFLVSVTMAILLDRQAWKESAGMQVLRKRADQLETQRQGLQQRNTELAGKQQLINLALENQHPPAPAWILGYLGQALPAELVATNLRVTWQSPVWKLHLAGTLQTDTTYPSITLSNAMAMLADRLAGGPFHLTILRRSDDPDPAPGPSGERVNPPATTGGPAPVENSFWIEGVMR